MAGDAFQRVQAGEQLQLPAVAWNAMLSAAEAHQRDQNISREQTPLTRQASVVSVKNISGTDCPRFGVLKLDAPIITPTNNLDEFQCGVTFKGNTPELDKPFVIALEPIADGEIGRAVAAGVVVCQIDVQDELHNHAVPSSIDELKSSGHGSALILWKQAGTGTKWAIIRLGIGAAIVTKFELQTDLEQFGSPATAWKIDVAGSTWTRQGEPDFSIHPSPGLIGVLFGTAGDDNNVGDPVDAVQVNGEWYALGAGKVLFGSAFCDGDIAAESQGTATVAMGQGDGSPGSRQFTLSVTAEFQDLKTNDELVLFWASRNLDWHAARFDRFGCGFTYDDTALEWKVDAAALAGTGLTQIDPESCTIDVDPSALADCGLQANVGNTALMVNNAALAGACLTPSGTCSLDVDIACLAPTLASLLPGCGLQANGSVLDVNPNDLAGLGLSAGSGCSIDINTGCGLELVADLVQVKASDLAGGGLVVDGNCSLKVNPGCGIAQTANEVQFFRDDVIGNGLITGGGTCDIDVNTGCGLHLVGGAVEVKTSDFAGQGLNSPADCDLSVLLGCNMEYGASGEIQPDVAALAGDGLTVDSAGPCDKLKVDCTWIDANCGGGGGLTPGCGLIENGGAVDVDNTTIAGSHLLTEGACALGVDAASIAASIIGCGLVENAGVIDVDNTTISGTYLAAEGACGLAVDMTALPLALAGCGLEVDGESLQVNNVDLAGTHLVQEAACGLGVDAASIAASVIGCGLVENAGVIDVDNTSIIGTHLLAEAGCAVGVDVASLAPALSGCGLHVVADVLEVKPSDFAGQGLNSGADCDLSVLLGCNMEYGPSGEIQPAVASLVGNGLQVQSDACDKLAIDCAWIEANCNVGGGIVAGCGLLDTAGTWSVDNASIKGTHMMVEGTCAIGVDVASLAPALIGCGLTESSGVIYVDNASIMGTHMMSEGTCQVGVDVASLAPALIGCGLSESSGVISVDHNAILGTHMMVEGTCAIGVNVTSLSPTLAGCGLTDNSGVIDVDNATIAGTHMATEGTCAVGVEATGLAAAFAGDGMTATSGVMNVTALTDGGITVTADDIATTPVTDPGDLDQDISATYDEAEVQAISDKVDALMAAMRTAKLIR